MKTAWAAKEETVVNLLEEGYFNQQGQNKLSLQEMPLRILHSWFGLSSVTVVCEGDSAYAVTVKVFI